MLITFPQVKNACGKLFNGDCRALSKKVEIIQLLKYTKTPNPYLSTVNVEK